MIASLGLTPVFASKWLIPVETSVSEDKITLLVVRILVAIGICATALHAAYLLMGRISATYFYTTLTLLGLRIMLFIQECNDPELQKKVFR